MKRPILTAGWRSPDTVYSPPMAVTLVTGASGGLGAAFARLAAADGSDLVLVARSEDVLEALAAELRAAHGVAVTVLAADLSHPSSVERLAGELSSRGIDVETLVNNAGIGSFGPFAAGDSSTMRRMIALNVDSPTLLARSLLPGMVARKRGRVLNVASTAAFQPGPLMAVYYATKAYVLHWSLALRDELAGTGVTVTCLCPGPTKTGFQKTAGMLESPLFKRWSTLDAATVARAGYEALRRGRATCVPGLVNKLGAFGTRLIPRTLAARVARMAQETPARP